MPMITDDTGTQGKGRFQLELGWDGYRDESDDVEGTVKDTGASAAAALSYGLSESIDLIASVPYSWKRYESGADIKKTSGQEDVSLQLKWRFLESGGEGLSLALKPGLTFPSGDEHKGLGNGRVSGELLFIATQSMKKGAVHLNFGYSYNEFALDSDRLDMRQELFHASIAGELYMSERLRVVADIGIDSPEEKDAASNPVYLLGGFIYSPSENFDIDFGLIKGLNDCATDYALSAGLTMRFQ